MWSWICVTSILVFSAYKATIHKLFSFLFETVVHFAFSFVPKSLQVMTFIPNMWIFLRTRTLWSSYKLVWVAWFRIQTITVCQTVRLFQNFKTFVNNYKAHLYFTLILFVFLLIHLSDCVVFCHVLQKIKQVSCKWL